MMNVGQMLEQARRLSYAERVELVKRLIDLVAQPGSTPERRSILEFEGIAAHTVDDEDPQEYLKRLRSEWVDRT